MTGTSHYLTVEEVRAERQKLLDELNSLGVPEDDLYEYAQTWSLRPNERTLFQKITDYDWILGVAEDEEHRPDTAAV